MSLWALRRRLDGSSTTVPRRVPIDRGWRRECRPWAVSCSIYAFQRSACCPQQDLVSVEVEKRLLARRECCNVDLAAHINAHALKRRAVRDGRDDQPGQQECPDGQ